MNLAAPISPRYHLLDAWRGAACLMIAALHSSFYIRRSCPFDPSELHSWVISAMGALWVGVPMFFVISGYCIMAAVDSARRRPDASLRQYFGRRIRRIFPPYWATLLLVLGSTLLLENWLHTGLLWNAFIPFPNPADYTAWSWMHNVTLTAPLVQSELFVGVAWTLAYEEQFYAVAGICLLLSRRRLCFAMTIVTIMVIAIMQVGPMLGWSLGKFFFNGYWLPFAAGALVYGQTNYGTRRTAILTVLVLLLGASFGLFLADPTGLVDFARQMIHSTGHKIPLSTFVGSLFGLLLLILKPYDAQIVRYRPLRPLMWTGTMCYSIYLIHLIPVELISGAFERGGVRDPWLAITVVVPICIVASVAAGWMFFVLVERRFLNTPPAYSRDLRTRQESAELANAGVGAAAKVELAAQ